MRWKWLASGGNMMATKILFITLTLGALGSCDGARRITRRKDVSQSIETNNAPAPSTETLAALAQATGATEFEHYTEGKALVKRLIPNNSQPDLDVVVHQGVIGRTGVDFPAFPRIPITGFSCRNVPTGYYADLETDCQVFHICDTSRKISFLCPNGTIFSQSHLICDWWFKVDCASSPALYESSAEYYSNEQRKTKKISLPLLRNSDLQHIDSHARAESRRAIVNLPSTTERFLRHRQRLQDLTSSGTTGATARSYQVLFNDVTPPLAPTQSSLTTTLENRRKNLVQLINGFNSQRSTTPAYFDITTYRTTFPPGDHNSLKEMQIAAESASFTNNNNRQFIQDFNNKNYRPYPVYTPDVTIKPKAKTNPNLTKLYDIREKQSNEYLPEPTTKRITLQPYTKSFSTTIEKQEPYTRPGVSLLKEFLEKKRNESLTTSTEKLTVSTETNNKNIDSEVKRESKDSFETATKIPQIVTTKSDSLLSSETESSDRYDINYSTKKFTFVTPEPSYQERRQRLLNKMNLDFQNTTPSTLSTTEKYYGDQPKRPGLNVPPSLAPKSLHSLAIYYATDLDNISTVAPSDQPESTTTINEEYQDALPALFSTDTINKYSSLFGSGMTNAELLEEIKNDPNATYNELMEDLAVMQSQNPIATSPQIRELAQVFTHALSAYLQDPVQFRKVLSDIRPTHPSFTETIGTTEESLNTEPTTTVNEDDDEILGFSDDNRHSINALRSSKSLKISNDYTTTISDQSTTTIKPFVTAEPSTTFSPTTTFRSLFKCCGRISASYTTVPPFETTTTPSSYTTSASFHVNIQTNKATEIQSDTTTENSYSASRLGGFQNNNQLSDSPYGQGVNIKSKPLNEYIESTNLPTAWGMDIKSNNDTASTTVAPDQIFESKKIKSTTVPGTVPVSFTEAYGTEIENEEELQRAHSQSFAKPQQNSLRHGKELNLNDTNKQFKKPSEDLEAPTVPDYFTTPGRTTLSITTRQINTSTTKTDDSESSPTTTAPFSSIFTSPEEDYTPQFQFPTSFGNWHSTMFLDPLTLNDGLSSTGPELSYSHPDVANSYLATRATTSSQYTATTEPTISSTINVDISSPGRTAENRFARVLKDSSTESGRDLTTIADTVAQKAKEIMGEMNSTTTEKLMNVMKKTKSKSVKRLILLLVQTCDDDHNSTAEASKRALLDALMAVSKKDMEEIENEETGDDLTDSSQATSTTESVRRMDGNYEVLSRRGKSLDFSASAVNSLSISPTTEVAKTTEFVETSPTIASTLPARRGVRKFQDSIPVPRPTKVPYINTPVAQARIGNEPKPVSDTRALELLKSLYTIAARWG